MSPICLSFVIYRKNQKERRSESAIQRAVPKPTEKRVQITYKIKTTDRTSADTMESIRLEHSWMLSIQRLRDPDIAHKVRPMPLPNFFIVGAPKAGTDLLYYQFDRHPEIYMSPLKEPCYFSTEIRIHNFHPSLQQQVELAAASLRRYLDAGAETKRFGGIVSDLSDYENLFARAEHEKAIGEASVCYLWSETAAPSIAEMLPHARIIIVLMDPSERAFHQYLKSFSDSTVDHSFRRHVEIAMKNVHGRDSKISPFHPFLALGEYAQQVERYLKHFPMCQLSISLYEDTQTNYSQWFNGLLSFLGVDNRFAPPDVEVPSKPHLPRVDSLHQPFRLTMEKSLAEEINPKSLKEEQPYALPTLCPEDRAVLVAYYREDILRLQDLIQRDLSSWLR